MRTSTSHLLNEVTDGWTLPFGGILQLVVVSLADTIRYDLWQDTGYASCRFTLNKGSFGGNRTS